MLTNQSIGYMNAPIPKGLDLKEEINRFGFGAAGSQDNGRYHCFLWCSFYGGNGEGVVPGQEGVGPGPECRLLIGR